MPIGSLPAIGPQTAVAQTLPAPSGRGEEATLQTEPLDKSPQVAEPSLRPRQGEGLPALIELFRPDPAGAEHYAEYGPLAALFLPATTDPVIREQRAYLMAVLYPPEPS